MTLKRPDAHVQISWCLYSLFLTLLLGSLCATLFFLPFVPDWVPIGVLLGLGILELLLILLYFPLRYRQERYAVAEGVVTLVSGVWFANQRTLPLVGVRHITLVQGPLEHLFGLAFVVFSAAGGVVVLEGVPLADAQAWSRQLIEGDGE